MTIGERILEYRKANNLSQEEIAEKLDVSRQTISKWETDQSTPDFDKIAPLCKLFNITADELVTGKKNTLKDNMDNNLSPNVSKGLVISISVFLYFVAVSWIIFGSEVIAINDGILISVFLLICAVATCILIFYFVSQKKDDINLLDVKKKELDEEPIKKAIKSIISLLTTCVYILISFWTMAWHITWIIWLIYAAIISLVDLLFDLAGDKNA